MAIGPRRGGTGAVQRHRIVILGGGFGGIAAASKLPGDLDVTLIARSPHFEFLPNIRGQEAEGDVDDLTVLRHLALLRATHPWVPSPTKAGLTDLRIHRVIASSSHGVAVEVRAAK